MIIWVPIRYFETEFSASIGANPFDLPNAQAVAPPDTNQVMQAFEDATRALLHRRGVTGIHDVRLMADRDGALAFQAFQRLNRDGGLALRSWITLPGDRLDDIIGLGLRTGFGNDRLRFGHVNFFCDGGMGARTAWLIDPYRGAERGMPLTEVTALDKVFLIPSFPE